jgi:hypothetical protein
VNVQAAEAVTVACWTSSPMMTSSPMIQRRVRKPTFREATSSKTSRTAGREDLLPGESFGGCLASDHIPLPATGWLDRKDS